MSVIIVGGGMAGSTLALAISSLTQGSMPVDLIELNYPDECSHPGFDARVIALAPGTCHHLMRIGIWPTLRGCTTAITKVHISDRNHVGFMNLKAQDYKVAALGQVIALHDAGKLLLNLLKKAPGITLHCPARVIEVIRSTEQVKVLFNDRKSISGKLLVAADGSNSRIAQACNMHWKESDYLQYATIANITTEKDPQGCAFERFTCYGPIAMLPISQGRSALVWCHNLEQYQQVSIWNDNSFINKLQNVFGWRLGRILKAGKRHSYPLKKRISNQHVSHRLALVGNAAQTLHPIAGQGFNLGLRDVISLAETIAEARDRNEDPGGYSCLHYYKQRRQQDQKDTIAMIDNLMRLFANRYGLLIIGRNLGFLAMACFPTIRDSFIKHLLGWVKY